jgi:peptidoglycan biosynthesis protein MviN/MurJ (putative lipid II flippase)
LLPTWRGSGFQRRFVEGLQLQLLLALPSVVLSLVEALPMVPTVF